MYEENRFEYTVRNCPIDDSEGLEELLNDMAAEAWELYSLNEAETEEGEYQYLCIFTRQAHRGFEFEEDYIVDAGDFKTTMKRLLNKKDDMYKECRFLQQQIKEKNHQIKEIKDKLDSGEDIDREALNREISERMGELSTLKAKFSELLSPSSMYNRISQEVLTIVVSYELVELIDTEKDGDLIAESVKLRQKLTDNFGYVIPRVHFAISDEMGENEYGISVRSLKAITGLVYPGCRRFFIGQSNLETVPENAVEDIDPITGQQVFWLAEDKIKDFWDSGMTPSQVIISHLEFAVRKYVDEILSYKDILNYIALLSDGNAFIAEELLQKNITIGDIRYIFANLIRERVPIKDIVYIFEKVNDISKEEKSNDKLLEALRLSLKRHICSSVTDSNNTICAITVPKKYKIKKDRDEIIEYISEAVRNTQVNVIISESQHRKDLFDLVENIVPGLVVISEDEITEEFTVEECL